MIDTWTTELPHGITLSCRSAGTRGRPVLMFLHGFPEAAFVWDELLAHFAQPEHGGYRCVAPNLRGYERSSSPPEPEAYRAKHLIQDIAALIAQECGEISQLAALVAHDWGGALAWGLAAERPQLLQRLVIINSPHPQTFLRELQHNPAQQAASAYMNFLARPDAETLLAENDFARLWPFFDLMGASGPQRNDTASPAQANAPGDPKAATQGLDATPSLPLGAGWMTDALREQYRTVWRGDGSRPGAGLAGGLNYYRASPLRPSRNGAGNASDVTLPPDAFTITVPTLVLWAVDDTALLPGLLEGLAQWVPQMTLQRIQLATHWVVHEQPMWVARNIALFLAMTCASGERPSTAPQSQDTSPVGWYVGSYQLRFIELDDEGNDEPDGQFLLWTNTVIVKADSLDHAFDKVTEVAISNTDIYRGGPDGVPVRWVFEGITRLLPVYEPLGDGAEIMWEEEEDILLQVIRERAISLAEIKSPPGQPRQQR
jgi:pimeloyl-ACP methyl ester carboxylesterase